MQRKAFSRNCSDGCYCIGKTDVSTKPDSHSACAVETATWERMELFYPHWLANLLLFYVFEKYAQRVEAERHLFLLLFLLFVAFF
jgi:hypothetical protein